MPTSIIPFYRLRIDFDLPKKQRETPVALSGRLHQLAGELIETASAVSPSQNEVITDFPPHLVVEHNDYAQLTSVRDKQLAVLARLGAKAV